MVTLEHKPCVHLSGAFLNAHPIIGHEVHDCSELAAVFLLHGLLQAYRCRYHICLGVYSSLEMSWL